MALVQFLKCVHLHYFISERWTKFFRGVHILQQISSGGSVEGGGGKGKDQFGESIFTMVDPHELILTINSDFNTNLSLSFL